jgi:hypothetical protein
MTDITAFSHACTNFSHSVCALQDTAVLLRTSLLWQQCEYVSPQNDEQAAGFVTPMGVHE